LDNSKVKKLFVNFRGGENVLVTGIVLGCILVVAIVLLILSFRGFASEQERFAIERFGGFSRSVGPGPVFALPLIERIRAILNVWEIEIKLFEEPVMIDFHDGSAAPKDARAFVRVHSPDQPYDARDGISETGVYRAIYIAEDWRTMIGDRVENALRSYLNGLTIDEGITAAKAGYDLTRRKRIPRGELNGLKGDIARWGFDLNTVTVGDFDLDPELVKARGELHRAQREMEAATQVRVTRARETMGTLIQMMAEVTGRTFEQVQQEVATNDELQERLRQFAEEVVTRRMSIDGKALMDIRTSGGGDIEQVAMRLIAATRGAAGGRHGNES